MDFSFAALPTLILDHRAFLHMTPSARLVYEHLIRWAGWQRATWWTSVRRIAAAVERSERTVQRALRQLQGLGLIEQWRRVRLPGGQIRTFPLGDAVTGHEIPSEYHLVHPDRIRFAPPDPGRSDVSETPPPARSSVPGKTPAAPATSDSAPPTEPTAPAGSEVLHAAGPTSPPSGRREADYAALKDTLRQAVCNAMDSAPEQDWLGRCAAPDPGLIEMALQVLDAQHQHGAYHGSRRTRWVVQALREIGAELRQQASGFLGEEIGTPTPSAPVLPQPPEGSAPVVVSPDPGVVGPQELPSTPPPVSLPSPRSSDEERSAVDKVPDPDPDPQGVSPAPSCPPPAASTGVARGAWEPTWDEVVGLTASQTVALSLPASAVGPPLRCCAPDPGTERVPLPAPADPEGHDRHPFLDFVDEMPD